MVASHPPTVADEDFFEANGTYFYFRVVLLLLVVLHIYT